MCEKFYCEECKKKLDMVYVDGYEVGDRLLEDVIFEVENVDGKPVVLGVEDDSVPYFHLLNKKLWLKRCQEYCQELDTAARCPVCGWDVDI